MQSRIQRDRALIRVNSEFVEVATRGAMYALSSIQLFCVLMLLQSCHQQIHPPHQPSRCRAFTHVHLQQHFLQLCCWQPWRIQGHWRRQDCLCWCQQWLEWCQALQFDCMFLGIFVPSSYSFVGYRTSMDCTLFSLPSLTTEDTVLSLNPSSLVFSLTIRWAKLCITILQKTKKFLFLYFDYTWIWIYWQRIHR